MKFDPDIHHRRSIRLAGYDYSLPGAYFVTIDTWHMEHIFGEVVMGVMQLNRLGRIVQHAWDDLPDHYPYVTLDAFCIMPNHVHGIIVLTEARRGGSVSPGPAPDITISGRSPTSAIALTRPVTAAKAPIPAIDHPGDKRHGLPEIVRAFKSYAARRVNLVRSSPGVPVWQRNYFERILRGEEEWERGRAYIINNPIEWEERGGSQG